MKRIYCKIVLVALLLCSVSSQVYARECIECKKANAKNAAMRTKAAGCKRAQSTAELNVNNVRAQINGYGNMWYDGNPQYHIPKNANTCPLYCAALWIGGTDVNDQLRLAALSFGQFGDDFWPGPLRVNRTASVDPEICTKFDKHWIITKQQVQDHIAMFDWDEEGNVIGPNSNFDAGSIPDVITTWPAHGDESGDNLSHYLAPFFDADGDGEYSPEKGDYPYYDFNNELCPRTRKANLKKGEKYVADRTLEDIAGQVNGGLLSDQVLKGDQTIWWVFNDKGNTHTESNGNEIGLEIRAQAFAFSTNDEINNMTFYSYEIINRSTYELQQTYFSQWVDPDLGYGYDDYVGCDVRRGLGYCYNGKDIDGPGAGSYSGIPPAVGIDFFQGPYMDADGKDNPKINIPYILSSDNPNQALRDYIQQYYYYDSTWQKWCYDTIAISDDADMFFNIDHRSWYFVKNDTVGNCAINGVNFGNGIVDDERFGMRRFVFYNNGSGDNTDPRKANDYYNYLRGRWKNNQRMKYGGNALNVGVTELDCDFMFPGDSDPWHWGTNGEVPSINPNDWNEVTAGNSPYDRRFMQSAGPFTLKSGALNYITVGIPFAQASNGNAWSSVELLREIDDVCQALFENCFKVLDGPDAPTMTCQELENEVILYLSYENPNSNNYMEKYNEVDPSIVGHYTITNSKDTTFTVREVDTIIGLDTTYRYVSKTITQNVDSTCSYTEDQRSYKFEGYQIYQLRDATVSIADIGDITKARLVAQCDIENYYDSVDADGNVNKNPTLPIGTLVNYTSNSATGLITGKIMVEGANKGIQHVFRITTDQFADGVNTSLVNNREYYFIAIAYAQNRYKEYSQTEAAYLDGQKEPYLSGRKNEKQQSIKPIVAIPHSPAVEDGGKYAQSEFGMCPKIIRLDGYGNGNSQLRLTDESISSIMGAPNQEGSLPGKFVNNNMQSPVIITNPQYEENYGPINVRVIDPLKIKKGDYKLLFWNGNNKKTNNVAAGINENTKWCLTLADATSGKHLIEYEDGTYVDTVWSDFSISRKNEQLFLDMGIAVTLVNPEPAATDLFNTSHLSEAVYGGAGFYDGFANPSALLGSSITFKNPESQWLTGIPDNDASVYFNWIRSGNQYAPQAYNTFISGQAQYSLDNNVDLSYLDEDYFKTYQPGLAPNYTQPDWSKNPVSESMDKSQVFEAVVGGMWSPYALVSTLPFHPGFNFSYFMPEDEVLDSIMGTSKMAQAIKTKAQLQRYLMTNFYNRSLNYNDMSQLPSVRIVMTADTTKWTRCPVIEMCDDHSQSEGNARKFTLRRHPSVDKLGRYIGGEGAYAYNGTADNDNPSNPAYIADSGMGWFPGYAINTVTGERLNIMFGEDSRYIQYNGRDMMWNPASEWIEGSENYVYGGRHYIYVMNSCMQPFADLSLSGTSNINLTKYRTPSYDAGRWALKMLGSVNRMMKIRDGGYPGTLHSGVIQGENASPNINRDSIALLYASVAWVNMPLTNARYQFKYPGHNKTLNSGSINGVPYVDGIACDVTIDIDVRSSYGKYLSFSETRNQSSDNGNMPAYQFSISADEEVLTGLATAKNAQKDYVDSILGMISVVPNPYYSYSEYETLSQLETKVRIINLPTGRTDSGSPVGCTVNIYTVDGTLVRTLGPTEANATTLDWDLHNHTGQPIAGGVYLIHVKVPGIGERVVKWFGTMRPVDLNSYQF